MSCKVNLAGSLERCSGDMELLNQVVDETLQKVKSDQLPQIKQALIDGDMHAAHFATHSIKGASATIGFDSLSHAAKALDDLVRVGTQEGAEPLLENLETALDGSLEYWEQHDASFKEALERVGDDMELLTQIAQEMATDLLPEQLTSLEEAIAEASAANVDQCSDEIMEAGVTIGAARLIKMIGMLKESTSGGSVTEESRNMVEKIKEECADVCAFWAVAGVDE